MRQRDRIIVTWKKSINIIILGCLFLSGGGISFATSTQCGDLTLREKYINADLVFVGKVVEIINEEIVPPKEAKSPVKGGGIGIDFHDGSWLPKDRGYYLEIQRMSLEYHYYV